MRENISPRMIELYSRLFGIKRKVYVRIFKENNRHFIKRIVDKSKSL